MKLCADLTSAAPMDGWAAPPARTTALARAGAPPGPLGARREPSRLSGRSRAGASHSSPRPRAGRLRLDRSHVVGRTTVAMVTPENGGVVDSRALGSQPGSPEGRAGGWSGTTTRTQAPRTRVTTTRSPRSDWESARSTSPRRSVGHPPSPRMSAGARRRRVHCAGRVRVRQSVATETRTTPARPGPAEAHRA